MIFKRLGISFLALGILAPSAWADISEPQTTRSAAPAAPQAPPLPAPSSPRSVNIVSAAYLSSLNNVIVAPSATFVIDVGKTQGASTVRGNLTNSGQLYFISTNPAVQTATLNVNTLTNNLGAVIATRLPQSVSSLLGATNVGAMSEQLGLIVNASSIKNLGVVSSSGQLQMNSAANAVNHGVLEALHDLTINSGGSFHNAGVVSAGRSLSVHTGSGYITNTGLLSSIGGNVNLDTMGTRNLVLNNILGSVAANQGAINLRDALYSGSKGIFAGGGDWSGRSINFYGGRGEISVDVESLLGSVNTFSDTAHVRTHSNNLVLGTIKQTGDPTYINASGDITITGNIQVGEALALIASGSITSQPGVTLIQARNLSGQGFPITLVAGANVTGTPSGTTPPFISEPGAVPISVAMVRLSLAAALIFQLVHRFLLMLIRPHHVLLAAGPRLCLLRLLIPVAPTAG